jgi:hypothetical protein
MRSSDKIYERKMVEGLDQINIGGLLGCYDSLELAEELHERQLANNPEEKVIFRDSINRLSKEAKEVIGLVFNTPVELVEFVKYEKDGCALTLNILRNYLRYYGWEYRIIENAFQEIKKIF